MLRVPTNYGTMMDFSVDDTDDVIWVKQENKVCSPATTGSPVLADGEYSLVSNSAFSTPSLDTTFTFPYISTSTVNSTSTVKSPRQILPSARLRIL